MAQALRRDRLVRRMYQHHFPLGLLTVAAVLLLYVVSPSRDVLTRVSFATAYPALFLVATTLILGPLRLVRKERVPVSFDLRRDVGIWAGLASIVHSAVGQNVHLRGRPWLYYVYPPKPHHSFPVRHDMFGAANITGLLAALFVIALFATSNDKSLRRLGTPEWKQLQRWNYAAFALICVHTFGYLSVENKLLTAWAVLVTLCIVVTVTLQSMGFRLRRQAQVPA